MSWPKGKPRSEETRGKIRAWSLTHREQLSRHISDEQKHKSSIAMSCRLQGNKRRLGIPHTEETKKRISQTLKHKWASDEVFRKSCLAWRENLSPDDKRRITKKSIDAMRSFWQSLKPEERLAINENGRRAASLARPTSIELAMESLLKSLNIAFESQKPIGKYIVDIYIPSENLVIECDGDYWHSLPQAIKRDKEKNKYLQGLGYKIARIAEHNIKCNTVGIQSTIFNSITEA